MSELHVKIVSDGTARGTRVVNRDTGQELHGVVSIEWSVDVNTRHAQAAIGLLHVPIEAEGIASPDPQPTTAEPAKQATQPKHAGTAE